MKLRKFFFAALAAAFVLVGCEPEENGGGKVNKPLTTIDKVSAGGTYNVLGTVAASADKAFILSDATGVLMVYVEGGHNVVVGEQVLVEGPASQEYSNNALQINPTKVTKTGKTQEVSYDPKSVSAEELEAYLRSGRCDCEELELRGVITFSEGTYINVAVNGTAMQGSVKYRTVESMAEYEGKSVIIKGYLTTTYNYLGILAYSVELDPAAEPFIISLTPSSLNFTAEGGSESVTALLSTTADVTVEAESSSEAFDVTCSEGTVTVVASALAEGAPSVTGTITVNLVKGGVVVDSETIPVYQAAYGEKIQMIDFTTVSETDQSFTGDTYGEIVLTGSRIALNQSGQFRVYANDGTFTLSVQDANITSIEITVDASNGDNLVAEGYADGKWTGSASSVTFTNGSKQTRIKTIKVVYQAS